MARPSALPPRILAERPSHNDGGFKASCPSKDIRERCTDVRACERGIQEPIRDFRPSGPSEELRSFAPGTEECIAVELDGDAAPVVLGRCTQSMRAARLLVEPYPTLGRIGAG